MAKAFYWTSTDEDPDRYHTNRDCSKGKKILPENLEESDTKPSGRSQCTVC